MSPNPTIISQSKEAEEDRSIWKIIVLAIVGAGLIFGATYFFNTFLLTANYRILLLSSILGGGFFIVTVLETLFIKSRFKIGVIMLLNSIVPLAVFYPELYPNPSVILLTGSLLLFVFLIFAVTNALKMLSNSLKIRFFSISKAVLSKAVTGLLIFLSVVLYLQYFGWGRFNDALGRDLVGQTLDSSRPIVGLWFSGVSFSGTVGDFLDGITESQLRKIGPNGARDFQKLSPPEKTEAIRQLSLKLKKELEKVVGPLRTDQPLKEAVYSIGKGYVNNLSPTVQSALGVLAALAFFLTVKGIAVLLYWLIGLMAFVVYKFLLIIGFAHISLESRSREFVMLS